MKTMQALLGFIDEAGSGQADVQRLCCRPRHTQDIMTAAAAAAAAAAAGGGVGGDDDGVHCPL